MCLTLIIYTFDISDQSNEKTDAFICYRNSMLLSDLILLFLCQVKDNFMKLTVFKQNYWIISNK